MITPKDIQKIEKKQLEETRKEIEENNKTSELYLAISQALVSNPDFAKDCDAIIEKRIDETIKKTVAEHLCVTPQVCLGIEHSYELTHFDHALLDRPSTKLFDKYLVPILKEWKVKKPKRAYKHDLFTRKGLINDELLSDINDFVVEHWEEKLRNVGYELADKHGGYCEICWLKY